MNEIQFSGEKLNHPIDFTFIEEYNCPLYKQWNKPWFKLKSSSSQIFE